MTTYTNPLGLIQPTPRDPAVANIWGTLLNTNQVLLAASVAGYLSKSVAGNSNVVLTVVNGAPDEARTAMFVFTGVLTGNIIVLWPNGQSASFSVSNNTTGAFTLSVGVDNGSGGAAGTIVGLAQGGSGFFGSDGTNVFSKTPQIPVLVAQGGTGSTNASDARTALGVPTGVTGHVLPFLDGNNHWTSNNVFEGVGTNTPLRVNSDGITRPAAYMNTTANSLYTGMISWGSSAPGALVEGQIYLQTT